jgi:hypothetical protein
MSTWLEFLTERIRMESGPRASWSCSFSSGGGAPAAAEEDEDEEDEDEELRETSERSAG